MEIIGYHAFNGKIADSTGRVLLSNFIEGLLVTGDEMNICYNLNWFAATLFRLIGLTEDQLRKLHETTIVTTSAGYSIKFVSEKFLRIMDFSTNKKVFFSDALQYSNDKTISYDDNSPATEAKEAQRLGNEAYNAYIELGLHPRNLISPVKIFSNERMKNANLPTIDNIPDNADWYFTQCCKGGWVESYKKGHFPETWDYDMVSAYASKLMNLYDTRYGKWVESSDYIKEAAYGACLCNVEITSPFSPLLMSPAERDDAVDFDNTTSPIGIFPEPIYLTKSYIDFIRKYKIGRVFKILSGHWWIPEINGKRQVTKPLKKIIAELYNKKHTTSGMTKYIAKRIMNGLWGYTGQDMEEDFGDYFNPVWHATVESEIRLDVARFVLDNGLFNDLLSVIFDGVLTTKPAPQSALGDGTIEGWIQNTQQEQVVWEKEANCPAYVVYSGFQALRDKEVTSVFGANYEWLKDSIADKPNEHQYTRTRKSVYTLAQCVQGNCLDKLGDICDLTKSIDVIHEAKRCYFECPENGHDLQTKTYNSMPVDVSMALLDIDVEGVDINNLEEEQ